MRYLLVFVLLLHLVIYDEVTSYGHNHRHYGRGQKSYGKSGRHYRKHGTRMEKSKVLMPSGKSYAITVPDLSYKWKCSQKSKLVTLHPNSKRNPRNYEYNIVKHEMEKANKGGAFTIVKIQKIINSCLWHKYRLRRKDILKETKYSNDVMLFHGSTKVLELVDKGFDERYANAGGTFGPGVYFADQSSLSHIFTVVQPTGNRLMLFCRVAMGKIHTVKAGNKFFHPPVGYHSVKGDIGQTEYIVYRGEQAYPEYLISYK